VTERLARASALHPVRTLLAWLGGIVLAIALVATLLGGNLTSEGNVTNNPESVRAADILEDVLPVEDEASELVIVRSDDVLMVDTAVRLAVEELLAEAGDAVESAEIWHESQNPTLVSEDGAALLVPVELTEPEEDAVEELVAAVQAADERNAATRRAPTSRRSRKATSRRASSASVSPPRSSCSCSCSARSSPRSCRSRSRSSRSSSRSA
jgi:uncharacterized membrane protein YdfJ with MMPL/SSD domain